MGNLNFLSFEINLGVVIREEERDGKGGIDRIHVSSLVSDTFVAHFKNNENTISRNINRENTREPPGKKKIFINLLIKSLSSYVAIVGKKRVIASVVSIFILLQYLYFIYILFKNYYYCKKIKINF